MVAYNIMVAYNVIFNMKRLFFLLLCHKAKAKKYTNSYLFIIHEVVFM